VELRCDGIAPLVVEPGAGFQCECIFARRETLDLVDERCNILGRIGQLVVIPRRRRIGRERELIRNVDARIVFGLIRAEIKIQDLRQQDDSVEIDRAF
jgi:hypothetical protein